MSNDPKCQIWLKQNGTRAQTVDSKWISDDDTLPCPGKLAGGGTTDQTQLVNSTKNVHIDWFVYLATEFNKTSHYSK